MKALTELEFKLWRIMTPALDQGSMFSTETTRAMMVQLFVTGIYTKWKASAAFQMSSPAPITVNTALLQLSLPCSPTAPMSCASHGSGTLAAGVALA